MPPKPGVRIVVQTPDRREFRGVLLEVKRDADGREIGRVRLDTGWETTYPLTMIAAEPRR
jgi:hypothetical protein